MGVSKVDYNMISGIIKIEELSVTHPLALFYGIIEPDSVPFIRTYHCHINANDTARQPASSGRRYADRG